MGEETLKREFEDGDKYWFLESDGGIVSLIWRNYFIEARIFIQGNTFHTREEAEAEKMRRESMAKRFDFIPKSFGGYWQWSFFLNKPIYDTRDNLIAYWNIGAVHRTEEECKAWGEKYAKYFQLPQ